MRVIGLIFILLTTRLTIMQGEAASDESSKDSADFEEKSSDDEETMENPPERYDEPTAEPDLKDKSESIDESRTSHQADGDSHVDAASKSPNMCIKKKVKTALKLSAGPENGVTDKPERPPVKNIVTQLAIQLLRLYGFSWFKWNDYGHYCGYNGPNENYVRPPIDECDNCCKTHDICYDRICDSGECNPYTVIYSYSFAGKSFVCHDSPNSCAYKTCRCDLSVVECLVYQSKVLRRC